MVALSLTAFVDCLREHQLLLPSQVEEVGRLSAQFPDAQALARELLRRGWLTAYQANQVLQGRGKDLVLGPYRLLERLGEGGMGKVFKARHIRMDRLVALKIIHPDELDSPKAVQRFAREARAAAQLAHPNIVLAHDADQVGNVHFLAMEYVEGTDLAWLVKQSGPLPVAQACEYARQAALGLQHAHEKGLVHRDIKPGNLLLTRTGPEATPLVKILDFGLARFESEAGRKTRLTTLGNLVGTVDYVAPEQAENARTADIRADIYSLGCSLYYLLIGQPPFPGDNVVEKMTRRVLEEPPSVRAVRPEVPGAVDRVVARMMARKPSDRFQTPAEVAVALQALAAPREVTQPPSLKTGEPRSGSPPSTASPWWAQPSSRKTGEPRSRPDPLASLGQSVAKPKGKRGARKSLIPGLALAGAVAALLNKGTHRGK
jgi:serine/threonine-protein kinase